MNRRLRRAPPKQRLAQRSGNEILPIGLPSELYTVTPLYCSPGPDADPQIAVGVTAEAVRDVAPFDGDGNARIGELGPVVDEIVAADHARHDAVVGEIDLALVGREAKPVGPQITGNHRRAPGLGIEPVDIRRQLRLLDAAFIRIEVRCGWIGEPDRVVGFDHHVIRRVERLAIELVDQHRDAAVVLRAREAARVVLAGDRTGPGGRARVRSSCSMAAERRWCAPSPRPSAGCDCWGCRSKGGSAHHQTTPALRSSARRYRAARRSHCRRGSAQSSDRGSAPVGQDSACFPPRLRRPTSTSVVAAAADTPASMVRLLISIMSLPDWRFFVGTS